MDLATPIDMAAGMAHRSAIVHVGAVRVEVLAPSLLRLEYSPSQHFENSPTVNAAQPADAGPSLLVLHLGGLADRPHSRAPPCATSWGQDRSPRSTPRSDSWSEAGHPRWRRRGSGSAPSARSARPARPRWAGAPL